MFYLDKLDTDRLEKIRDSVILDRKCSPVTANRYLAALSATLHYAHKKKLAAVPSIPTLEVPESEFTVLTQEKAVKLLAELTPHLNAMMRFSLATGLREANVRELRWSQVNLSERVAWIWARKAKARKMIGVPLNDTAIEVLQGELGRHPEYVFTFAQIGKEGKVLGRRPIARKASNSSWYKALKRAGLEGLRWHDLRHAWATWHAQAGTPMLAIQAMGGWATSSMVQRYAHLAGQNLHAEAAAIRVPNVSPRMLNARFPSRSDAESADALLDIPVFIGVDEGIRTPNNRNHKANVGSGRNVIPLKINSLQGTPASQRRRKTGKGTA